MRLRNILTLVFFMTFYLIFQRPDSCFFHHYHCAFSVIVSAAATSAFQSKYQTIFPNKNLLQLKIREVRQRMMAEAQIGGEPQRDASTPSTASSLPLSSLADPIPTSGNAHQGTRFNVSNASFGNDGHTTPLDKV